MKIAIGICERVNGICTTMGCFKALNNKDKHFSAYKDKDLELISFFTCDACSKNSYENLMNIAEKLKQASVEKLHFGVCVVKCEEEKTDEIKKIFENHNIEVIEGTH
ncbi:CGGC domain-containing protein [uncultured Clostridium sp.]|uniref:CGGC domain-containing protein n=1 Tax=uncultured Clostridium sp. TaxID=59620 RepID=UPI00258A6640|nr:CGGC domain-containing protein [uncultured Clostridium sp.]MDU1349781.1 CGGC domain-containing protein [Clostridium argentinense]